MGKRAPFNFGTVGWNRVGFADIPAVGFAGWVHKSGDARDFAADARMFIWGRLMEIGLNEGDVRRATAPGLVHIRRGTRLRRFTDSHGVRRMGHEHTFWLEIDRHSPVWRLAQEKLPRVYTSRGEGL